MFVLKHVWLPTPVKNSNSKYSQLQWKLKQLIEFKTEWSDFLSPRCYKNKYDRITNIKKNV